MKTKTRKGWDKRKWKEDDFTLQVEDMSVDAARGHRVAAGRVLAVPPRTKTIQVGVTTTSIELCLHGKPLKVACPTCEFEAPRLIEKEKASG